MHFKNAVILCALYFVTSAQSMGLNRTQLKLNDFMCKKYEHCIDIIIFQLRNVNSENINSYLGMELLEKDGTNAKKAQNLLVFMASNDKRLDDWNRASLTSYEVTILTGVFNEYDQTDSHYGLLDLDEVNQVIRALNLDENTKEELKDALVKGEIKKDAPKFLEAITIVKQASLSPYEVIVYMNAFNKHYRSGKQQVIEALNLEEHAKKKLEVALGDILKEGAKPITAATFLKAYLKAKPAGRGLNKKLVQDLIDLYEYPRTDGVHINPDEITKFFQNLSIVKKVHEDLLVFESIRTAAFQLQELLLVLAKYNEEANKEVEIVYSTGSVRFVLWDFNHNDGDNNGLLSKEEFKGIDKRLCRNEDVDYIFGIFDLDDDEQLTIAEFFMLVFVEYERWNP